MSSLSNGAVRIPLDHYEDGATTPIYIDVSRRTDSSKVEAPALPTMKNISHQDRLIHTEVLRQKRRDDLLLKISIFLAFLRSTHEVKYETSAFPVNSNTVRFLPGEVTQRCLESTDKDVGQSKSAVKADILKGDMSYLERQTAKQHNADDDLNRTHRVENIPTDDSEANEPKTCRKRKDPEPYPTVFREDSSEDEYDDSDLASDIIAWNNPQTEGLPSFIPYIHSHEIDTSSCSDSPGGGSGTESTASQDTPASSVSFPTGGNGVQGNGNTPLGAGMGSSSNSNKPILGDKSKQAWKSSQKQPLSFVCWYAAAGVACPTGRVKRSTETRYLWRDHAWGIDQSGPNHRLPDKCQLCDRLFFTQEELDTHVRKIRLEGPCPRLSTLELEVCNSELNSLGISVQCGKDVEKIRSDIDKQLKKGNDVSGFHDELTMAILKKRMESNVALYINGSDAKEKTARSELWKWYLIFKKLRPSDEIPLNPFVSKQQLSGLEDKARNDALCMFNRNIAQNCEDGHLPSFTRDQCTALGSAFLATLEMLGANEAQHNSSLTQRSTGNQRKKRKISYPEDTTPAIDPGGSAFALWTPRAVPRATPVSTPGITIGTTPAPTAQVLNSPWFGQSQLPETDFNNDYIVGNAWPTDNNGSMHF